MSSPIYKYSDIERILGKELTFLGDPEKINFTNLATPAGADEKSLIFISSDRTDKVKLIKETKSKNIIIDNAFKSDTGFLDDRQFILVENPEVSFAKIGNELFLQKPESGIHPTAVIHPKAEIGKDVYIGAYSVIGSCKIGDNVFIGPYVHIHDNTVIGDYVKLHEYNLIGNEDFGFEADKNGEWINFPHLGGVILEDFVEIFPYSSVGRGSLGNTIIREGAKIDHHVQIGHNTDIGRRALITVNSVVGGSSKVGEGCWVGMNVTIRDRITIGKGVTIGMGSVVLKDIPDNTVVIGNPAQPIEEAKKQIKAIKKLADN